MKEPYMIKALWIDDQPTDEFLDDAYDVGITIVVGTSVSEGLQLLNSPEHSFDAIILDANCIITDNPKEAPDINALQHAILQLYSRRIDIPWFVFTGGSYAGKEAIEYIIPNDRPWDDRKFYDKATDEEKLFANIINAVQSYPISKMKMQYAEICKLYQESDLIDLLIKYENRHDNDFDKDTTIPNTIRGILEWVMQFCHDRGVLICDFTGSNIADCSKTLGNSKLSGIIPNYIQRSFHWLSEYSNAGSHRYVNDREKIIGESTRKDIGSGIAKFLNRTAVDALLNVLKWCNSLSDNPDDIKKMQEKITWELNKKNN